MISNAQAVIGIARSAGNAIMDIYKQNESDSFDVKDDGSPLTQADKEANNIILSSLSRLDANVPILREEASIPEVITQDGFSDYYWLVDP